MCYNSKANIRTLFLASTFIYWSPNSPRSNPWDGKQKFPELNCLTHLFYGHRKSISTATSHQYQEMLCIRSLRNFLWQAAFLPSVSLLKLDVLSKEKWEGLPPTRPSYVNTFLPDVTTWALYPWHLHSLLILSFLLQNKNFRLLQRWQDITLGCMIWCLQEATNRRLIKTR